MGGLKKDRRHGFSRRVSAFILTLCFFLSSLPVQGMTAVVPPAPETLLHGIPFPASFGTIEEDVTIPGSKRIFYIQDAHDSLEAQENIAQMVQYFVREYGVGTAYEEGYDGTVPTDAYFDFIQNPTLREKVSYFFLDTLRIGGAEYAHINRKQPFRLIGADNSRLHRENVSWYQSAARKREETARDLRVIETAFTNLIHGRFPKPVHEWIRLEERRASGDLPLMDFVSRLERLWLRHISREDFQSRYPFSSLLLEAAQSKTPKASKGLKELDYQSLFGEWNGMGDDFAARFLEKEEDRRLFHYSRGIRLLERLSRIEVTSAEYDAAKSLLDEMKTRNLASFLADVTGRSLVLSNNWERNLRHAVRFYEIAEERDRSIEKHIDEFLAIPDEQSAVLVFGGFHRENIKKILRSKKMSYTILSPRLESVSEKHREYYRRLMAVGRHDFETRTAAKASRPILLWDMPNGRNELRAAYEGMLEHGDEPVPVRHREVASRIRQRLAGGRSELRSDDLLSPGEHGRLLYELSRRSAVMAASGPSLESLHALFPPDEERQQLKPEPGEGLDAYITRQLHLQEISLLDLGAGIRRDETSSLPIRRDFAEGVADALEGSSVILRKYFAVDILGAIEVGVNGDERELREHPRPRQGLIDSPMKIILEKDMPALLGAANVITMNAPYYIKNKLEPYFDEALKAVSDAGGLLMIRPSYEDWLMRSLDKNLERMEYFTKRAMPYVVVFPENLPVGFPSTKAVLPSPAIIVRIPPKEQRKSRSEIRPEKEDRRSYIMRELALAGEQGRESSAGLILRYSKGFDEAAGIVKETNRFLAAVRGLSSGELRTVASQIVNGKEPALSGFDLGDLNEYLSRYGGERMTAFLEALTRRERLQDRDGESAPGKAVLGEKQILAISDLLGDAFVRRSLHIPPPEIWSGRSELRAADVEAEINQALEQLLDFIPKPVRPGRSDVEAAFLPEESNGHNIFRRENGIALSLVFKPDVFVDAVRKVRSDYAPRTMPWRFVYTQGKNFHSFLMLYGYEESQQIALSLGPVDFHATSSPEQYRAESRKALLSAAQRAQINHDAYQGIIMLDGAHASLIAAPGASREKVIQQWSASLSNADILGTTYVASLGTRMSRRDMDKILLYATDIRAREAAGGKPFLTLIPPAVGGQLAQPIDNLYGIGPVAAILALKRNPHVQQRFWKGKELAEMQVAFFGYGHVASEITNVLLNDYPADIGIRVTGVADLDAGWVRRGGLPRALLREANSRIAADSPHPLISLDAVRYHPQPEEIKGGPMGDWDHRADLLVLASLPMTFRLSEARLFQGKIVVEATPETITQGAIEYLRAKGVLIIPYSSVNVGAAYAARHEIARTILGETHYESRLQILDGITGYTLANLWQVLSRMDTASGLDYTDLVRQTNEGFTDDSRLLYAQAYRAFPVTDIYGARYSLAQVSAAKRYLAALPDIGERVRLGRALKKTQLRMNRGVPYILALRTSVFEEVFARVIAREPAEFILDSLKLSGPMYRIQRRIAAYRLGQGRHSRKEMENIIPVLGQMVLHDEYHRVRAEAAKALGLLRAPEGLPFLKQALFNPRETDARVRHWVSWGIQRLGFNAERELAGVRHAIVEKKRDPGFIRAQQRALEVLRDREARESTGDIEVVSAIQTELIEMAGLNFREGEILKLLGEKPRALRAYERAIEFFRLSQQEGAIMPFQTQGLIAELYTDMGQEAAARRALLKRLTLNEAAGLWGKSRESLHTNDAQSGVLFAIRSYRRKAIQALLELDGYEPEVADAIGGIIHDYLYERESRVPDITFYREYEERVARAREDHAERPVLESEGEFAVLSGVLAERVSEVLDDYRTMTGLHEFYDVAAEDPYLKLLLLQASNVFQPFPYLERQVNNVLSRRVLPASVLSPKTYGQKVLAGIFAEVGLKVRSELRNFVGARNVLEDETAYDDLLRTAYDYGQQLKQEDPLAGQMFLSVAGLLSGYRDQVVAVWTVRDESDDIGGFLVNYEESHEPGVEPDLAANLRESGEGVLHGILVIDPALQGLGLGASAMERSFEHIRDDLEGQYRFYLAEIDPTNFRSFRAVFHTARNLELEMRGPLPKTLRYYLIDFFPEAGANKLFESVPKMADSVDRAWEEVGAQAARSELREISNDLLFLAPVLAAGALVAGHWVFRTVRGNMAAGDMNRIAASLRKHPHRSGGWFWKLEDIFMTARNFRYDFTAPFMTGTPEHAAYTAAEDAFNAYLDSVLESSRHRTRKLEQIASVPPDHPFRNKAAAFMDRLSAYPAVTALRRSQAKRLFAQMEERYRQYLSENNVRSELRTGTRPDGRAQESSPKPDVSEARSSALEELARFGITKFYDDRGIFRVDLSELPANTPWAMTGLREPAPKPVIRHLEELVENPVHLRHEFKAYPQLSNPRDSLNTRGLYLGFIEGIEHPVAIKLLSSRFPGEAVVADSEVRNAQILDAMGLGGRFWGVLMEEGKVAGYAFDVVLIDQEPAPGGEFLKVFERQNEAGLFAVNSLVETRGGGSAVIDAGNIKVQDEEKLKQWFRRSELRDNPARAPAKSAGETIDAMESGFTVFLDYQDLNALTDRQVTDDILKMALRQPDRLTFVFYGDSSLLENARRSELRLLQEQLGMDRIRFSETSFEHVYGEPWTGERIHVSRAGSSDPDVEKIAASARGKRLHRFQYLGRESGVIPVALLYADSGETVYQGRIVNLGMVSPQLVAEIETYLNSLVFARAA